MTREGQEPLGVADDYIVVNELVIKEWAEQIKARYRPAPEEAKSAKEQTEPEGAPQEIELESVKGQKNE